MTDNDWEEEPLDTIISMMRFAERYKEEPAKLTSEDNRDTALFWAQITRALAAERQAAALERIANSVNSIDIAAQRSEERLTEIEGQLGRIAAVLENINVSIEGDGYIRTLVWTIK